MKSKYKIQKKMIEKLEENIVDYFAFDYFKRNDNKKCIEISNSNRVEPVDRFFLFIDHTDCSPMCFVVRVPILLIHRYDFS